MRAQTEVEVFRQKCLQALVDAGVFEERRAQEIVEFLRLVDADLQKIPNDSSVSVKDDGYRSTCQNIMYQSFSNDDALPFFEKLRAVRFMWVWDLPQINV